METGVTPWAFFVGSVQVSYDSSEANTRVAEDLEDYIAESGSGMVVRSNTAELELNTDAGLFKVDWKTGLYGIPDRIRWFKPF